MIQGSVVGLQARVDVLMRLTHQPDFTIEFVIDTGFEGAMTLPPAAITALGLPYVIQLNANLANNSSVRPDVYQATIVWDGVERDVAVLAMGRRPLIGTALLDGFNLNANFEDGGPITLRRL